MSRRWLPLVLTAALLAALAVPALAAPAQASYDVTITRTEYGIPHIVGRDFASVGYGYGYAFTQDNLCVMAADYVTVNGERSRWFGPHGSYQQRGNGVTVNNLDSDFFWQQVKDSRVVEHLLARAAPMGPSSAVRALVRGYVAGYNRYLHDVGGAAGVRDPQCHGKRWVRPITERDAYLRFYQLVLLAGEDVVIPGIAQASPPPPGSTVASVGRPSPVKTGRLIAEGWHRMMGGLGSNAVAVGRAGTRDHTHGLLLGNPHFPWLDTERFYQAQLTIPGKLDVTGGSLFGVPLVLIGYNRTMAWSHTVSTAFRFTPYQLTLVPGAPTTYLFDGKPTRMQPRATAVVVRENNGSLGRRTRTLWWTRYGPVFTNLVGVPLPWTATTAFAMRDANADHFRGFNHLLDTDRATSVTQELGILTRYEGIPWVNTIVADKAGNALYADIGAVPNVPNTLARQCDTTLGAVTFTVLGLPVLDGSRSACDWRTDRDAVEPGLFGPRHLPHLLRSDYVTNSNDSYWLSNPHHPLEGFARIIGDERTARTLRTRIGLIMTQQRVDGSDRLGPAGFTRQDMQGMVFGDRQYAGELTRDALVSMCRQFERVGWAPTSSGPPVAVGDACNVLARWDLHENLGSRAAILFRRFFDHASGAVPSMWRNPFDAANPVNTPNGLETNNPQVRTALGDAIADLRGAHIRLDATVGSQQYVVKDGRRYPIHGGPGDPNGEFNAIWSGWADGKGTVAPEGGSSYVQVVTWNDGPCPDARTILTYSESTDPTSAHYADQTALFSHKQWVTGRFCASQIAAAPQRQVTHLIG